MKEEYIVLRGQSGATGPESVLVHPKSRSASGPTVTVERIDYRELPQLVGDKGVIGVAPAMPMALIKPVEASGAISEAVKNMSWGVNATRADTSAFSGSGVVVAILDTGIAKHAAFEHVNLTQEDFTNEGLGDRDGHGTHCAGTVFGQDVNGTRIGVAPGISRALIGKVLGDRDSRTTNVVRAVMWAAEHHADIISMSLGVDFPGYARQLVASGYPQELAISRALEGYRRTVLLFERLASTIRMYESAPLLVAAAGNESRRKQDPRFRIEAGPPAVSEGILSVAAVGRHADGRLFVADFSNIGALVAAPGVDILSAARNGGLAGMSGTSMATPHVAGVAALWAEKLRSAGTPVSSQLKERVIASSRLTDDAGRLDPMDVGAGMVLAPQN